MLRVASRREGADSRPVCNSGGDILEVYSDRHTIPNYAGKAVVTATQG
jgi:hypothetical protein